LTREGQTVQTMLDGALLHHQNGRLLEAEQTYKRILAINPDHPDCLHLLGMLSYQSGDLETAANLIRRAISIHKTGVSYYLNLGTVLSAQGKLDEAETLYRHALTLKPNLTEVHVNLGNVLQARGQLEASVECYEKALALRPDSAEAYNNLGNARQEQCQMDAAIACYEKALAIKPDYAEVYYNLGNASRLRGNLDEAVRFYEAAIAIKPEYPEAFYNLGNVRRAQGDVDDALRQFAKALALRPEYAQAGFGEALAQLLQGNFAVGWDNFERRWQTNDHDTPRREYAQPAWTGEKLASGNLLIWGEQGVGDEIMFAGLIPEVVGTGNSCFLECNARLKPLFARSFESVAAVTNSGSGGHQEPEITAHLPSGSLPRLFRRSSADFAATRTPYLIADSSIRDQLLQRYADGRRLIGIAWYTNNVKTGTERSIDLSRLAPLFDLKNLRWISLQYGDHDLLRSRAEAANAPIFVDRAVDQLADMDLFAAQIAAMDLVITIDNSTAHLAGALGVPVWVLLPFAPDWRWLLEREDCPWYPSMRLFRQPLPGDWEFVVKAVCCALADVGDYFSLQAETD